MKNTTDNFEFKLVDSFPGYNSASDKTKLAPGFLIRGSKNVYKKLSGTIASRPGLKRRGSVDATTQGVKSSHEWATSLGTTRPLRVCDGKLQVESDIVEDGEFVWYDLLQTSTLAQLAGTYTRFSFDTWWDDTEKSERLVAVRGDDNIFHWSGGIAKLNSAALVTTTGVTVLNTSPTAGGSGYSVGQTLTITGGGGSGATCRVEAVNAGAVTQIGLLTRGTGYTAGSGYATTGTGTGCTVAITTVGNVYSITKSGTDTWAESGFATVVIPTWESVSNTEKKIIINGVEYSYLGGEGTTTITDVIGGDPTALAVDSVIIQSVLVSTSEPISGFEADFIKVIGNQVWLGSYSSRVIYISADSDFLDFENAGSYVYGDPDKIVMDNNGKGIGISNDGRIVLFAGDADMYVVTPNVNVTYTYTGNDGGGRFIYQKIEKRQLAGFTSALGHEFIGNFGEYLVWLDQKNQLRALGTFANVNSVKPVTLSLAVQAELEEDDFTGGHLRVIGDTIHLTAPNNGRDWMYQVRENINDQGQVISEKLWHPPQIRGIARFAVIEGILYGHSNVNPQIYQIWDTEQWFDDHPSEEPIPYTCVARFAYRQHERRQGLIKFDRAYFEGYMPQGVELNANFYINYKGSTAKQMVIINNNDKPAKFWPPTNIPNIGDSSFGDNPLGDGILEEANEQESMPKFRDVAKTTPISCFEYSVELYSESADSRWEILVFGTNVVQAEEQPVYL
jgi:hypothetical protein